MFNVATVRVLCTVVEETVRTSVVRTQGSNRTLPEFC